MAYFYIETIEKPGIPSRKNEVLARIEGDSTIPLEHLNYWSNWKSDIIKLSKEFPETILELGVQAGNGEYSFIYYYLDGDEIWRWSTNDKIYIPEEVLEKYGFGENSIQQKSSTDALKQLVFFMEEFLNQMSS